MGRERIVQSMSEGTGATNEGEQKAPRYVVHIVESPRDTDLLTGRQDREPLHHVLRQAGIKTHEYLAVNAHTFGMALGAIAQSHQSGVVPILHLSAHGNGEGIALTSGDLFTWAQLRGIFIGLNKLLDGGLLLCMSTCEGFSALKMVASKDDAPFHTVVGPMHGVDWRDSLVAFVTFYHLVITREMQPNAAEDAMNSAAGLKPQTFRAVESQLARNFHAQREREEMERLFDDFMRLVNPEKK